MGRDVFSYSKVLVSVDDMAPFFNSYKLAVLFAKYLEENKRLWPGSDPYDVTVMAYWDKQQEIYIGDTGWFLEETVKTFNGGNGLFTLMRGWTYACQQGESLFDIYIEDEATLVDLWNHYLKAWMYFSKVDIPLVSSVETFGRRRDGAWDIERLGHPYLAFNIDDTFESVLTPKGRDLQDVLGQNIKVTSWSTVSD